MARIGETGPLHLLSFGGRRITFYEISHSTFLQDIGFLRARVKNS